MHAKISHQYCQDLLSLPIDRSRALCNSVMALASYPLARSVTELSESPLYHYQYPSLHDAVSSLSKGSKDGESLQTHLGSLFWPYYERPEEFRDMIVLQSDVTPMLKRYSEKLADRMYVAIPNNPISTNKPLDVGYEFSHINLCTGQGKWSLPLSIQRVKLDQTANECLLDQLDELFSAPELKLGAEKLVVNTLDSAYGTGAYLAPSYAQDNLVNVARLRAGMKVWTQNLRTETGGRNGYYGDKHYLRFKSGMRQYKRHPQTHQPYEVFEGSIFELPHQDLYQTELSFRNGRKATLEVYRWNNLLLQAKNGHITKDKPFDLLAIKLTDQQTGKPIFNREMFLAVWGKKKEELSTEKAYYLYRHRYDIEPYFRFSKQALLFDKFQTPILAHLEAWTLVVQLTAWLLYAASKEVELKARKWERYLPTYKEPQEHERKSMAQTRRGAQDLFMTFDPQPFKPPKLKKGKGRQPGEGPETTRDNHPPRKKVTQQNNKAKKTKIERKDQKNE